MYLRYTFLWSINDVDKRLSGLSFGLIFCQWQISWFVHFTVVHILLHTIMWIIDFKIICLFIFSSSTGTTTGTTPTTVGHEASTKVASTTVVSSSASESANNSNEHKSCIEKAWREGVDYFKVENSIVCHDGESIQGSHGECICILSNNMNSIFYILYWVSITYYLQPDRIEYLLYIETFIFQWHPMRVFMFYSGNFMTNWLIRICLPWIRWQQQLLHTCTKPKWCITMKRSIPLITRAPWPVCNLAKVDFQALVAIQPLECPVACPLAIQKNCLAVLLCLWWTITMGRNDYLRERELYPEYKQTADQYK